MKKLLLLLAFTVAAAFGQPLSQPTFFVTVNPSGACTVGVPMRYDTVDGTLWGCKAGTWTLVASGGGGGGGGITTLNGLTGTTQTFGATNDTNVNLSITSSGTNHQFAMSWAGTLAKARQYSTTIYTDQANTFGAYLQDFGASSMKVPTSSGFTSSAASMFGFDSTAGYWHFHHAADQIMVYRSASVLPSNGDCAVWGALGSLGDAGAACGSGGASGAGYIQTFTSQTSVTLTPGLSTKNVVLACYDNSGNTVEPLGVVVGQSTPFNITVTFLIAQTGYCIVTAGGAGGGGGGTGTVTSVGWTGGIISIATPTATPAFTVAGTAGGIVYFPTSSTWASSGAYTQYSVLLGGGAGAAPTATAADTTTTHALFATATAPAFRALAYADLPSTSQNYVVAGPTSGSGPPSPRALVAADIPAALGSTNSVNGTTICSGCTLTQTIANGTAALNQTNLGTSSLAGNACATTYQVAGSGIASTDVILITPNASITGITGYGAASSDGLAIYWFPTSGQTNWRVCNKTSSAIAISNSTYPTINWRVVR